MLGDVYCSALVCPRLKAVATGQIALTDASMRPRDAFKDPLGHSWCPACKHRGFLLNYGAEHGFPMVYFDKYAIGNGHGPDCWVMSGRVVRHREPGGRGMSAIQSYDDPRMEQFYSWLSHATTLLPYSSRCPLCGNGPFIYRKRRTLQWACAHCWRIQYEVRRGMRNEGEVSA